METVMIHETPEQVADRFARELGDSLRRAGRDWFRCRRAVAGLRVTLAARSSLAPSSCRVLAILREMRAAAGDAVRIMPATILRHLRDADPAGDEPSIDTINHALRELRDRGLARRDAVRGWIASND
jgi:hypothetical protein